MRLRAAGPADADWIAAVEADPAMLPFIGGNTAEEHRGFMAEADKRYLLGVDADGERLAYAILMLLADEPGVVYLRRTAVLQAGRGSGRAFLQLLFAYVFDELGAARLALQVFDDNNRARALYARFGFVAEPGQAAKEITRRDGTAGRLLPLMLEATARPDPRRG